MFKEDWYEYLVKSDKNYSHRRFEMLFKSSSRTDRSVRSKRREVESTYRESVLHMLVRRRPFEETFKTLCKYCVWLSYWVNDLNRQGKNPLRILMECRVRTDTTKAMTLLLIRMGSRADFRDTRLKRTCLFYVQDMDDVLSMKQMNVDFDLKDVYGKTALEHVVWRGSQAKYGEIERVKMKELLFAFEAAGTDMNWRYYEGEPFPVWMLLDVERVVEEKTYIIR